MREEIEMVKKIQINNLIIVQQTIIILKRNNKNWKT